MKIKRFILVAVVLLLGLYIYPPYAQAEDNATEWVIKVEGADGLKDTDWLKVRGKSDPYVIVYTFKKEEIATGIHFIDEALNLPEVPRLVEIGKTHVAKNTLKPRWNYKLKRSYQGAKKPSFLVFKIWDKDPLKSKFLGIAAIVDPKPGKVYNLPLKRRRPPPLMNWPGKRRMPGILTVEINSITPKVKVPVLLHKSPEAAKSMLEKAGFKVVAKTKIVSFLNPNIDRVVSQLPKPGKMASKGAKVTYYVGKEVTYSMPNIIGKDTRWARRLLKPPFRGISINYKAPPLDTPREKWLKVARQSPKPGTKISLKENIELTVFRPPADYKIVIPDVIGKELKEAKNSLNDAKVAGMRIEKKRIADMKQNGKIISQQPEPGKEIPWNVDSPVILTIGWYADGSTLYSAKLTKLGEKFEVTFTEKLSQNFRFFEITEPGYLVVTEASVPSSDDVNPLATYYDETTQGEYRQASDRAHHFPAAYRVTQGNWILKLDPEWKVEQDRKYEFTAQLVKEFDSAEPNNSFEKSAMIDPNAELTLGFIGGDDKDYYQFEIKRPGYLEIKLTKKPPEDTQDRLGSSVGISFGIYDEEKKKVGGSYLPNAQGLTAGKYYLAFEGEGDSWDSLPYTVDLTFHQQQDLGEPNDKKELAYNIKTGSSIPVAYDVQDKDYYLVESTEPGYALMQHDSKLPFTVPFYRYDDKGNQEGSMEYLPAAIRIDKTRLICIKPDTYETGYLVDSLPMLNIGFIPATTDKSEPNDTAQDATRIDLNRVVEALMLPRWEKDYYRFTASKTGTVFIEVDTPEDLPGELVAHLPIKGRVLSSDGETVIKDQFSFPLSLDVIPGDDYILELQQEPGLRRFCIQPYRLNIHDGSKEEAGDEKHPDKRYTTKNKDKQKCIDIAKQAYRHYLAKEYKEADKLYRKALDCLPNHPVIWNDFGATNYRLNDINVADSAFTKAIELNAKYALPWRNLAVISWNNENWQKGVERATKAAGLRHSDENLRYAAHAYIKLAVSKTGEERFRLLEQAAVYYRKMKELSESSRNNLAKIEKMLKMRQ